MIDKEKVSPEEQISIVDAWINNFSETGKVKEIDPDVLKGVLSYFGAELELDEESLKPLSQYTNKAKRPGLNNVWGKEKVDEFWSWIDQYITEYESQTGKLLPKLTSGQNFSGMRAFIGELTALAAGQMSMEDYKKYTEARIFNGHCWQEDRKNERIRIEVPTKDEPILLSSYPPEFPKAAWEHIKTMGKEQLF